MKITKFNKNLQNQKARPNFSIPKLKSKLFLNDFEITPTMLNNKLFVFYYSLRIYLIILSYNKNYRNKKKQVVTEAKNKIIQQRQAFICNQSGYVY